MNLLSQKDTLILVCLTAAAEQGRKQAHKALYQFQVVESYYKLNKRLNHVMEDE